MKVSFKIATGLALTVAALACGSAAQAGEGGAAGSVSIKFATTTSAIGPLPATTPDVARLSSSVAVGKNFAFATGFTQTDAAATAETRTAAVGAAGSAFLTNANAAGATYDYTSESAATVGTNQLNAFGTGGAASLAPITGVTLP
jgi:hypothetical protein